jgi:hydroxyacylglutathione hydrolase
MLFRLIYDDKLAQAAYLIGCQKTGEAVVIDPERDVDRYIRIARAEGLRITAAAETHVHADFLSGSRELAEKVGAKLYVSDEGGPDWKYQWLDKKPGGGTYDHQFLKDGETFRVGNIRIQAVHTPGHTPEHICFLVTDLGGGATEPMGMATGDFVFVGDLGRPDLLETAAGQSGAKAPAARLLWGSARKFLDLPEHLQVWPGHGAGSACGKALGAVPQSTVGYEARFNPALAAAREGEGPFVDFILEGQPEPPLYFARMKKLNKEGPPILGELPRPRRLETRELGGLDATKTALLDTRPWGNFREGHLAGSISAPLNRTFPTITGSYVTEEEPIVLIIEEDRLEEAVRDLVRIGLDRVEGYATPEALAGAQLIAVKEVRASELAGKSLPDGAVWLDVRRLTEYDSGHVPGSINIAHTRLLERLGELPRDKRVYVSCRSGSRSARAVSLLHRHGFDAVNVAGGFLEWEQSGGAVQK